MQQEEVQTSATGLAQALAATIYAIREALQDYRDYRANPIQDLALSASKWETVALPLLAKDLQSIQPCLSRPLEAANARTLLDVAAQELSLAKNIDALVLDFAGPDHERSIESRVQETVLAAGALIKALRRPL